MKIKDAARKVYDKLQNSTVEGMKLAVFLTPEGDDVQMTKPATDLFRKKLAAFPKALVGVYDVMATLEMIAEDIMETIAQP